MYQVVTTAEQFASKAHEGVTRKCSNEPFFMHPLRVAEMIRDHGGSPVMEAAAYLHDVLEDTEYRIDNFPSRVRELVIRLTKQEHETKMEHVERIGQSLDGEAILIKIADRLDNLRDGEKAFGKKWIKSYLKHTKRLVELAKECGLGNHPLAQILDETVLSMF